MSQCGDDDKFVSRLEERLLRTRTILISEPVTSELAHRVVASLLLLDAESSTDHINMIINSPGGVIDDGFAIYDTMRLVKSPIRTICSGLAASMATVILLGADKGQRYVLPNCRTMIHQPRGGAIGKASDVEISAKEMLKMRARINEILAEGTGQPLETIEKDIHRDHWLTAEEGVAYGLFDHVVTSFDEVLGK